MFFFFFFLILIKLILTELGPFELSHFERFDNYCDFLIASLK